MQTIILCSVGVFSTAIRWSPTRLIKPSGLRGLGRVREQRALECRVAPRLGDDTCADMRADFGLVCLDHCVERGRIDVALLGQHSLQRPHPQLHFGQFRAVLVMIVMIVVVIVRHRTLLHSPFARR